MSTDEQATNRAGRIFTHAGPRQAAFQEMSSLFGGKWHLPILYQLLMEDGMRFSQLQKEIAEVSAKMLSDSLERLESRYGLVEREIISDQPLRVEYSLSDRGESLEPVLLTMASWAQDHEFASGEVLDGSKGVK